MTQKQIDEQNSAWPACDILALGYFGAGTPNGARFRNRSLSALLGWVVLYLVCFFVVKTHPQAVTPLKVLLGIVPGLAFTYIGWEWWRYVGSLDELARRMQLDAAAWTYGIGMGACLIIGSLYTDLGWDFNPGFFFIFLEPVRATRLWVLSRKF